MCERQKEISGKMSLDGAGARSVLVLLSLSPALHLSVCKYSKKRHPKLPTNKKFIIRMH